MIKILRSSANQDYSLVYRRYKTGKIEKRMKRSIKCCWGKSTCSQFEINSPILRVLNRLNLQILKE
jgi:hypothetical protein